MEYMYVKMHKILHTLRNYVVLCIPNVSLNIYQT